MSKPESSIHDFMAVESFSQLPFIRPSTPQNNSSSSTSAIRLFGIDVPQDDTTTNTTTTIAASNISAVVDPVRRFECHYCCRNFPTSQALGGHQNAHKRERQHAKRAHLQSALAAHHHYQYRLHAPPVPHHHYYYTSTVPPRLGPGSPSQPITGSPLPGLWRVPHSIIHHDRAAPVEQPMFRDGRGNFISSASSSSSSATTMSMSSRLVCDTGAARVTENVSLDLHL